MELDIGPALVHRGARSAYGGAQHVGQLLHERESLRALRAAPARHHDVGLGQLHAARRPAHHVGHRLAHVAEPVDVLHEHRSRATLDGRVRFERLRAHGDHHWPREHEAFLRVGLDAHHVGDEAGAQALREHGSHVEPGGSVGEQQRLGLPLRDQRLQRCGVGVGGVGIQRRIVQHEHGVGSRRAERVEIDLAQPAAQHDGRHVPSGLFRHSAGGSQHLERHARKRPVLRLRVYPYFCHGCSPFPSYQTLASVSSSSTVAATASATVSPSTMRPPWRAGLGR